MVVLWREDFEGVALGPNTDETLAESIAWSAGAPEGGVNDRSMMPAGGVTEWRGWAIADKDWWVRASGDQSRGQFARASGNVAVADPDEWHDAERPDGGAFDASLISAQVSLSGIAAGSGVLSFDSTWDPYDEMRATITVRYDGGEPMTIMEWTSRQGEESFHPKNANERVAVRIQNPEGAEQATFTFRLDRGDNDWFWAIDNLQLSGEVEGVTTGHER